MINSYANKYIIYSDFIIILQDVNIQYYLNIYKNKLNNYTKKSNILNK